MKAWFAYDGGWDDYSMFVKEPTWNGFLWANDSLLCCLTREEGKKLLGAEATKNPRRLIEVDVKVKQVWEPC